MRQAIVARRHDLAADRDTSSRRIGEWRGIVEIESAQAFIREHHRAVLTTYHADGRLQLSPVLCGVDPEGRVVVSTRETATKTRNLRHDPRATICVFTDAFFGAWIQVDGLAEVVYLPEAMPLLVDYYRELSGEHPDWDEYEASMRRDRRVLVRIAITRAGPDRRG